MLERLLENLRIVSAWVPIVQCLPRLGNGPICLLCKIKTKETKCPRLPGSRGYRINKLASNLSVMSTLQLAQSGSASRHGRQIGLEATLGLIKIFNMPIYLLLLELAKKYHVSHQKDSDTTQWGGEEKLSPLFTNVHDDEFDGQWMSTRWLSWIISGRGMEEVMRSSMTWRTLRLEIWCWEINEGENGTFIFYLRSKDWCRVSFSLNPKSNTHKFIQSLQHQTNWVYEEVWS